MEKDVSVLRGLQGRLTHSTTKYKQEKRKNKLLGQRVDSLAFTSLSRFEVEAALPYA